MATTNTDYCTVEDVRDFLGIEDSGDDDELSVIIDAVSTAINQHCGQFFSKDNTATARSFHATNRYRLWTPPFHTTTDLAVKTDTSDDGTFNQTWTVTTDYVAEPPGGYDSAGLTVSYHAISATGFRCFPVDPSRPRVEVTAQWGWASVPDPVKRAAVIKAARLLRRSDAPEGILGGNDFGVVRITRYEDPDVAMLLAPYCRVTKSPVVG